MSQRDETGKEFDKMSNESIRERMRKYTEGCRLSYIEIGKAARHEGIHHLVQLLRINIGLIAADHWQAHEAKSEFSLCHLSLLLIPYYLLSMNRNVVLR